MRPGATSSIRTWLLGGAAGPAGQAFKLAGLTALAQLLAIAASPILTRLYTPAQLGIFGVFGACISLLNVLSFFRYEQAIPLAEGEEGGERVMQLCQVCLFVSLLVLTGAVWLGGERLLRLCLIPSLAPYRYLIPLGVLAGGVYILCEFWLIRQRRYLNFGLNRIGQLLTTVCIQIAGGLWGIGVLGLIAGQVVGLSLAGSLVVVQVWMRRPLSWTALRSSAFRYRHFGYLTSWSTLIKAVAIQGPMLLLAHSYGAQVAGWFALSMRAVTIPGEVFAKALSRVFLGEAARLRWENRKGLLDLFWPTVRLQALIGTAIAASTAILAPFLFARIFGRDWEQAGRFAQLLSIGTLAQFIVAPTEHLLIVAERQGLYAIREVMRGVLLLGPVLVAITLQASPSRAVLGYSLGVASFETLSFLLALLVLRAATEDNTRQGSRETWQN